MAAHRYERHIEHTLPYFTPLACESCHAAGKYDVPDQSKSMPGLLSASVHAEGKDRAIGTVPAYVTVPAAAPARVATGPRLINEDAAGDLCAQRPR